MTVTLYKHIQVEDLQNQMSEKGIYKGTDLFTDLFSSNNGPKLLDLTKNENPLIEDIKKLLLSYDIKDNQIYLDY